MEDVLTFRILNVGSARSVIAELRGRPRRARCPCLFFSRNEKPSLSPRLAMQFKRALARRTTYVSLLWKKTRRLFFKK